MSRYEEIKGTRKMDVLYLDDSVRYLISLIEQMKPYLNHKKDCRTYYKEPSRILKSGDFTVLSCTCGYGVLLKLLEK